MTWSYTDPSASTRDAVRFEIGDTDTSDQQLSNEEIDYALTRYSSDVIATAIYCCDRLIAKYSRYVAQSVGAVNVQFQQRLDHYRGLIERLRLRSAAAVPYVGGRSIADKDAVDEDADRVKPKFSRGMLDRTV